jgi:hypothetical protein
MLSSKQKGAKMTEYPKGLHRIKTPEGIEDDVQVVYSDGGFENSIPESAYVQRGYTPPVTKLPWRE